MRNPNANSQDSISEAEESLIPEGGSWFFPMISPWSFGEASDINVNGIDGVVGASGIHDGEAWRHKGNNGEGGGLGGWSGHG